MAEPGEVAVFPGRHDRPRHQLRDAACVLMLLGAVTAVRSRSGSATQAFLSLILWLLGVCLLALVAVEGRFPQVNQGAMPGDPARHIGPAAVQHQQAHGELVIYAARAFMLCGAAVAVSSVAGGNAPANATRAIVGLLLWFLGVWLMVLVPAAGRLPQAAAVANAVLSHLFAPWN